MSTLNILLPEDLTSFVDEQARRSGCGTTDEYVRALIVQERERVQLQQLRGRLLSRAEPARSAPVDTAYFEGLRGRERKAAKQGPHGAG